MMEKCCVVILSFYFFLHESTTLQFPSEGSNNMKKSESNISPCKYKEDPDYHNGLSVQCNSLGLGMIDPNWFPVSTTSIYLDSNPLHSIENSIFVSNRNLRFLSVSNSHISRIAPKAFNGLENLEVLDLGFNLLKLDKDVLNSTVFRSVSNLVDLRLGENDNEKITGQYPGDLFHGLEKLERLTLDTFSGPLEFGSLFENLTSLKQLHLTGGGYTLTNQSLMGLRGCRLKELSLTGVPLFQGTEKNTFQYLEHLQTLSIVHAKQGVSNTLTSLFPLQGRNMTSLNFDRITSSENVELAITGSAIVTRRLSKYMSSICVKHFTLTNSRVFFIERGVFSSRIWQDCVESIDLRNNPLLGDVTIFYVLPLLSKLKAVRLKNCRVNNFGDKPLAPSTQSTFKYDGNTTKAPAMHALTDECVYLYHGMAHEIPALNENNVDTGSRSNQVHSTTGGMTHEMNGFSSREVTYRLPPIIETIELAGCGSNAGDFENTIFLNNGKHLKHFDISDNGLEHFIKPILGLTNVSSVDFSHNDGQTMSASFFDSLSTVRHLRLRDMKLNNSLTFLNGSRLFRKLTLLEEIDLSSNGLSSIQDSSFNHCPGLRVIDLSWNRFTSIPIALNFLPNLQVLNMTHNSIISLSSNEMLSLETHTKAVSSFSLHLSGNIMSCGCSNIKFLLWLRDTKVQLDQSGNYLCTDQGNNLVSIKTQLNNIEALWRNCVGVQALYISVILLVLMILIYLICLVFIQFKTVIVYSIVALFTRNFALKTPKDYHYGVYIGYSDQDRHFACFELRRYLENELRMTTYLRDRDLIPATDIAESIIDAMNSSWRVLLLVTEDFLQREHWAFFTMKAAIYCVQSLNPNRIILIAEGKALENVPRSLLKIVPQNNIIQLDKPFLLGPDEREFFTKNIISI